MSERIVGSAARHRGAVWHEPAPARHHHVFCDMQRQGHRHWGEEETGFWTSEHRYVSREEAWIIAKAAGQLLPRAPTDGRGGELYSEDVW